MKNRLLSFAATLLTAVGIFYGGTSCSNTAGRMTYEDSIAHIAAQRLMQSGDFILTANHVSVGRIISKAVTPNTNFVMVRNGQAIVQATPVVGGGPNGLGGITFTGNITSYKVTTSKKGQMTAKFHLSARVGSADVTVILENAYNRATAYVSGDFTGKDMVFTGSIQSTVNSTYLEGRSF